MATDLSFKNELIKAYFLGSNDYIPSSELVYIHQHPLIPNTFLHELEALIHETNVYLQKKKMHGAVVNTFADLTIKIGALLPVVDEKSAPQLLSLFRDVYKFCNLLLKKNGI